MFEIILFVNVVLQNFRHSGFCIVGPYLLPIVFKILSHKIFFTQFVVIVDHCFKFAILFPHKRLIKIRAPLLILIIFVINCYPRGILSQEFILQKAKITDMC